VADLAGRDRHIIALGGGAALREPNPQTLAGRGKNVWLRASPEAPSARIETDQTTAAPRPNLTSHRGGPPIPKPPAERTPIYESCADMTIDTENKSPTEIASEIVEAIGMSGEW